MGAALNARFGTFEDLVFASQTTETRSYQSHLWFKNDDVVFQSSWRRTSQTPLKSPRLLTNQHFSPTETPTLFCPITSAWSLRTGRREAGGGLCGPQFHLPSPTGVWTTGQNKPRLLFSLERFNQTNVFSPAGRLIFIYAMLMQQQCNDPVEGSPIAVSPAAPPRRRPPFGSVKHTLLERFLSPRRLRDGSWPDPPMTGGRDGAAFLSCGQGTAGSDGPTPPSGAFLHLLFFGRFCWSQLINCVYKNSFGHFKVIEGKQIK